jgi:hypothetical protein
MKKMLMVVGLVGACGGGGSSSIAPEEFQEQFISAFCGMQARCGATPDVATCLATTPDSSSEIATFVAESGADGTITYDAAQAGDCIAAIDNASCSFASLLQVVAQDCQPTFTGKVTAGGDCFFDEQCASSNCEEIAEPACTDDECCPGTCGPADVLVAIDGDCSQGQSCVAGAYCAETDALATCTARVASGGECTASNACVEGLACRDFDFQAFKGTCGVYPTTGQPCAQETLTVCGDLRDFCDPTTDVCTRRIAVDGTCSVELENCVLFADCVAGTCVRKPGVTESCATQDCLGDLNCNDASTCEQASDEGACGQ